MTKAAPPAPVSLERRCEAVTKAGEPCKSRPLRGANLCHFHSDPAAAVELGRLGGRKGYRKSLPGAELPADVTSAADVRAVLSHTLLRVLAGKVDTAIANSAAILSGHLLKALEVSDLERRLTALEAKLNGGSK